MTDRAEVNIADAEDEEGLGGDAPTAEQLDNVLLIVAAREEVTAIDDPIERMEAARNYQRELGLG